MCLTMRRQLQCQDLNHPTHSPSPVHMTMNIESTVPCSRDVGMRRKEYSDDEERVKKKDRYEERKKHQPEKRATGQIIRHFCFLITKTEMEFSENIIFSIVLY